ncbi:glyoxalase superfamily protein [Rhizobium sp. SSA_523]|uniref:glyoxalase superfamily protein n=1 Tax=Rhizobium sp. SSA_523 TaxID=2952477 RepID=UPI0020907B8D|nr:glyoxalase superfamily protein [Rhizobium sp. SSA_523]MCO5732678.1 VOC family protein [Rhizobium sp. SSA_523]WKC23694.1 glyoxalase superfamily protein [Rhizobium sp. SSA_523]
MRDYRDAKLMAKALRAGLEEQGLSISHSQALELVAGQFGFDEWNVLSARIGAAEEVKAARVLLQPAIPVIRIFALDMALEFYRDFLGFRLDWEHRHAPDLPIYMQVSRSAMVLHLSEHAGDSSPGAKVFVPVSGVEAFHRELTEKGCRFTRPALQQMPWGLDLTVTDPFSNRLVFCEREIKA